MRNCKISLDEVAVDGARGQLLERGAAWALFRQDGVLPEDAPPLGDGIETDLAEYGFSLLRAALSLRERTGSTDTTRRAFDRAARAFEALTTNDDPSLPENGFYRVLAAAAYHLASYSAIAYSLLRPLANPNVNAAEQALSLLILRDLPGLRAFTREYLLSDEHGDDAIAEMLEDDEETGRGPVHHPERNGVPSARVFRFRVANWRRSARRASGVSAGYGSTSRGGSRRGFVMVDRQAVQKLHRRLMGAFPASSTAARSAGRSANRSYPGLRERFVTSLYARKISEVELWPSQLEAAERSTDVRRRSCRCVADQRWKNSHRGTLCV